MSGRGGGSKVAVMRPWDKCMYMCIKHMFNTNTCIHFPEGHVTGTFGISLLSWICSSRKMQRARQNFINTGFLNSFLLNQIPSIHWLVHMCVLFFSLYMNCEPYSQTIKRSYLLDNLISYNVYFILYGMYIS